MSLWIEEEGDCWTRFYELMRAKKIFSFPFPPFIISAGGCCFLCLNLASSFPLYN